MLLGLILQLVLVATLKEQVYAKTTLWRSDGLDLLPEHVSEINQTDLYLRQDSHMSGATVDQKMMFDHKNDLLVIVMPEHQDTKSAITVASNTIIDKASDLMMQVNVNQKECLIMKKYVPTTISEDQLFDTAFEDDSTFEHPNEVKPSITIEVELNTNVGLRISHSSLPEKFQPYCPEEFQVFTAHTFEEGKDPDMYNVETIADAFDYVPNELKNASISRSKRAIDPNRPYGSYRGQCRDHQNQRIDNCWSPHFTTCEGGCSSLNTLYQCSQNLNNGKACWFYKVSCDQLTLERKYDNIEKAQCFLHMKNSFQFCTMCCRCKNCGDDMPKCTHMQMDCGAKVPVEGICKDLIPNCNDLLLELGCDSNFAKGTCKKTCGLCNNFRGS